MKTDKTKKPGQFRYISFGDVHLGHRQTPTDKIIQNLDLVITDDLLKELDMVIITGDLFDRQLNNGDEVVHQINRWMTMFMFRCAAYNVMLRVVEGTPSHDREQSQFFVEQKVNANIPVDLYYTKELSIEYNQRLDAHFLYVPDKWRPTTQETLAEVRGLMAERSLEQVDFAIMHGAFSYQLPSIVPEPTHDENVYLELVKHQILIGHVHNMTVHERIYAAGSFDRICHGDEIPKGMFDFTVYDNGSYTATFVENKRAKQFVTLDVHGFDTKQLALTVREKVSELPKYSAIRLRCDPNDVANGDIETFRREYPNIEWSTKVEKPTAKKNTVLESMKNFDMSEFVPITKDNISLLIAEEMRRQGVDEVRIQRSQARFDKLNQV
ncbi:SbcD-like subunit of palindrome specific endonuclease [Pseudomonas phage PhiPA3]|uniref:Nuclease SbcCD, D subunit n=1 Tax=Pseudomonas phage PhiPA3 TaxID=998086 RepID=F8SJU1_BPPA3|nr:SbcD-like subunit of palindrome specific endonuclease [Pseudomonas phage PhiPA3]AEH03486.1 nuclease SbcCD, D subunit [Pseudomonas phage PhiPA3]